MVKIPKPKTYITASKKLKKATGNMIRNKYNITLFSGAQPYEKMGKCSNLSTKTHSISELNKIIEEIKSRMAEIVERVFTPTDKIENLTLFSIQGSLTKKILEQFKTERLLHKSAIENSVIALQDKNRIPYINRLCQSVPIKQLFCMSNDLLTPPIRNQIRFIVGDNTVAHCEKVRQFEKIFVSNSITELLGKKIKITEEFKKYLQNDKMIPDFIFTKEEINRLKQLTIKYDAIENILKKHKVNTDSIEALLYSGIEKSLTPGAVLPNKDIFLKFSEVYDKQIKKKVPTIMTFSNTDVGYRFKTYRYDKVLIDNIEKYKKEFAYYIRTNNYNAINRMDKKFVEYFKNMQVSDVFIELLDKAELQKRMEKTPDISRERIKAILDSTKDNTYHYIKCLRNFNRERYYNAAIPLIECLKEFNNLNKINEYYLEALSFNKVKHSPVGLYLRLGFKPIFESKEKIEKALFTKEGFDYTKNVWMKYKP